SLSQNLRPTSAGLTGEGAMKRRLARYALVLLMPLFFAAPAASAPTPWQRLMLPQNTGQLKYGLFFLPQMAAVDSHGNVYVADTYNYRIQKFDGSGAYLGSWGSQGSNPGQFDMPYGVAVDPQGNV